MKYIIGGMLWLFTTTVLVLSVMCPQTITALLTISFSFGEWRAIFGCILGLFVACLGMFIILMKKFM